MHFCLRIRRGKGRESGCGYRSGGQNFHYLRVHIFPLIVGGERRQYAPVFIRLNEPPRKMFHFAVFFGAPDSLRRLGNGGRGFARGALADFFKARTGNCGLGTNLKRAEPKPRAPVFFCA